MYIGNHRSKRGDTCEEDGYLYRNLKLDCRNRYNHEHRNHNYDHYSHHIADKANKRQYIAYRGQQQFRPHRHEVGYGFFKLRPGNGSDQSFDYDNDHNIDCSYQYDGRRTDGIDLLRLDNNQCKL